MPECRSQLVNHMAGGAIEVLLKLRRMLGTFPALGIGHARTDRMIADI